MAHQTENEAYYTSASNATPTDAITYAIIDGVKTYTLTKDVSLSNLGYHNGNCIHLAAGEVFDGARYTIYILGTNKPGLFDICGNTNPNQANRNFDDAYRCTIKNLILDVSGSSTLTAGHGGYIQKGHSSQGSSLIGVLIQNCISKRCIRAGAETGGFIGRGPDARHNVTMQNCMYIFPVDFASSTYLVEGGFWGTQPGRDNGSGNSIQHWDLSGCISYIELTDNTIAVPTPNSVGFPQFGALIGKGLGFSNNTASKPTITNCYVLLKVGSTYTACGLENGGGTGSADILNLPNGLGPNDNPPNGWDSFHWRGTSLVSGNQFTQTPTDGSAVLNTAFQSTPWDTSADATNKLPVFLTAGSSGSSGGDPYIFPLKSNIPVKLPNTKAVYRMFEQGNTFINAQVDRASPEHMFRMIKYAEKLTPVTHNIVTDGFFYSKFFIHAEGHGMLIDLVSKKVNTTEEGKKFFTMKQLKTRFDDGEFNDDALTYRIKWNVKNYGRVALDVLFFPNPHIENGIKIRVGNLKNATGMLMDNYKPKLMKLPSVSTLKYDKLRKRLANTENLFQKKAIKGKNEKWHFKK